jgi:IclR family acetate operon transcriptional repressor
VLLAVGSSQPLRFEHRAGERLQIHCSAMGKALLAFGGNPIAQTVALDITRQRGYAVSDEEQHLGVLSVAMVTRRPGEAPRAAVSVEGPTARMTDDRIEKVLEVLKSATALIAQLPILDRLPEV